MQRKVADRGIDLSIRRGPFRSFSWASEGARSAYSLQARPLSNQIISPGIEGVIDCRGCGTILQLPPGL